MERRVRRPVRTPEDFAAFWKEMNRIWQELDVAAGDEFVVTTVGKRKSHDEDDLGPFSRDSDTSRKAALDNYPRSGSQRHAVLLAIVESGGLTRDELAQMLHLPDSSVDGRVWELKKGGWVEESDHTRRTSHGSQAKVLVATEKGRREVVAVQGYREETLI